MSTLLEFDVLPALAGQLGRGLLSRRRVAERPELPRLEARVKEVSVDAARLAAYRAACGFPASDVLPVTYPQVLAAPLHAAVMAHATFPFPVLGLVHVGSRLGQKRLLRQTEPLCVSCTVEGLRDVRLGFEFDLFTHVDAGGERAWESTTTVLARTGTRRPREERKRDAPVPGEPGGATRSVIWSVPADQGRRYAGVSGDYNPIHLTALTARLFGFKRAIAHGMWTLARSLAELDEVSGAPAVEVEATFRRPVFLPSTVLFHAHARDRGMAFALRTREGGGVHLSGTVCAG